LALFAAPFVGSLWGCTGEGALSKPTAHLTGNVTINGEPVPSDAQGSIVFQPAGGGGQAHPTEAKINNSKYDAPHVPQGEVTAYFNIGRLTGRMIVEAAGGSPFPEMEQLAPDEAANRGIKIEVTGDDQKDFNL
jgi:hypothetical protein